jgi:hypothetical protein
LRVADPDPILWVDDDVERRGQILDLYDLAILEAAAGEKEQLIGGSVGHPHVRTVVESDFYKRVFADTRISPRKNTEFETQTTKRRFRYATSVGGTLAGRGAM